MTTLRVLGAALAAALLTAGCSLATVGDVPVEGETGSWFTVGTPLLNGDGTAMVFTRLGPVLPPPTWPGPPTQVFLRNLTTEHTTMVSVDASGTALPGGASQNGIDAAGDRVLFTTYAPAIPDDTNGNSDLYVRDVTAGTTTLATVDPAGHPFRGGAFGVAGGTISRDGNRVAFAYLDILEPDHAYVRDLEAGTTTDLGVTDAQFVHMSGDGNHFVVYPKGPADYSAAPVFIDPAGSTLAKRAFCAGVSARPLSDDGRIMLVSIFSAATCPGITGLQIWDRVADTLTPIVPNAPTTDPNKFYVSGSDATGRFIGITDGTVGPAQIRVLDRTTGTTRVVSTGPHGEPADGPSAGGSISRDGRRIAFWSTATNLVDPAATTGHAYVKDVAEPKLTSVTPNSLPRGTSRTVTLKGSGFDQPLAAIVFDGVTVSGLHRVDEHTITATLSATVGAPPGARDVWLLQGSSRAFCGGCLTLT